MNRFLKHWRQSGCRRSIPCPCRRLCRRLRHPQPRSCGRGAGVDEGGDDEARADNQRGQDLAEGTPDRNASTSLATRSDLTIPSRWNGQMVPERKPVQEEHATAQERTVRELLVPANNDPWPEVLRPAQQTSAGLVELLLLRDAVAQLPRCRSLRLRTGTRLPRASTSSGRARDPAVLISRPSTVWA